MCHCIIVINVILTLNVETILIIEVVFVFPSIWINIFEGYLDGTYSCYCPLNSSLDGTTECNDGSQCEDGNLGHITCGAKGLACKEKNKVTISRPEVYWE